MFDPSLDCALPLSLPELRARMAAGETFQFQPFYGGVFSQWASISFTSGGYVYDTAEHYMMAMKARLFGDDDTFDRVLASGHPREAKALGRLVKGFDFDRWVKARTDIVLRGNLKKFSQNRKALEALLHTRGVILVEASPYDKIWGVGIGEKDPRAVNPTQWDGENLLGFALTEVRSLLL